MMESNNGLHMQVCCGHTKATRCRGIFASALAGLVVFLCGGVFAEQCLTFTPGTESNQVTDFLQTDVTLPGDSAFTWEAWVNPAVDTLAENRIMGQTDWTSEGRLILELRKHSSTGGQNKFVCFYRVNGANARTSSPTAVVPAGTWTHVAVTRNGSTLKIYVNGVLDSTETNYAGPLPTEINSYPVRFGIGYAFNGAISDVRVWNNERSAQEIAADKDRRLAGNETGLVGYWPMNEGSGVPVNAVSHAAATINGYDGTDSKGSVGYVNDANLGFTEEEVVYTTTAAGGKWSEIAWTPSMPVSGSGAKIVLSGAGVFENDLGEFTLNSLSFTKAATMTGNQLVFKANGGVNPSLTSTGNVICNVNTAMRLDAPLRWSGDNASGSMRLNGTISGTGDLLHDPTAAAMTDYINGNNSSWTGNLDNRLAYIVISNAYNLGGGNYYSTNETLRVNGRNTLRTWGANTFANNFYLGSAANGVASRMEIYGETTFTGEFRVKDSKITVGKNAPVVFSQGISRMGSAATSLNLISNLSTVTLNGPLNIGGKLSLDPTTVGRSFELWLNVANNDFEKCETYYGATLACKAQDSYPSGAPFGSTTANAGGTIKISGHDTTLGRHIASPMTINNDDISCSPIVRIMQTADNVADAISLVGPMHFVKSGASVLTVTNAFYVGGTLEVASGTFKLTGGAYGRLADAVIVREGATLDLGGGTFACGAFTLDGGTIRNGTLQADSNSIIGGSVAADIIGENLSMTGVVSYTASVAASKTLSTNGLVFYMPFDSEETYLSAQGPDNVTLTCQKTVKHTGNNGSASCSVTEKKFGTGSIYLNGVWPLVPTGGTLLNGEFPASIPTGANPFTVAFFYKIDPTSRGYAQGMIGYGGRATGLSNNYSYLNLEGTYNHFTAINNYYYSNDARYLTGHNVSRQDGEWHSIVSTWDGTICRFYDDGSEISPYFIARNDRAPNVHPTNFWVGATLNGNAWKGWLDDVAIFNRAITADEVLAYHRHGVAGAGETKQRVSVPADSAIALSTCDLTNGLVFHMPFDSEADYLKDFGPDKVQFTCTPTPGVANQNTQGTATYTKDGKFGSGCVYLDGKSPLVANEFPAHVPTGANPYTFACCFKTVSRNNIVALLGYGDMTSNKGHSIWLANVGTGRYVNEVDDDYHNNGYKVQIDTGVSHNDGMWHTLVTSWDGKTWRYWLDGDELSYSTNRGAPNIGSTYFYVGGGLRGSRTWFGWLDEVAMWNRALSDAEVAAYNAVGVKNCSLPQSSDITIAAGATLSASSGLSLSGTLCAAGTIDCDLVLSDGARIVENAEGVPTVSGSVTIEGAGSFLPLAYPSASNRNPTYTILSAQGGFMGDSAAKVQTWSIEGLNAKYGLRFGIYDMLFSARVQSPGLIFVIK